MKRLGLASALALALVVPATALAATPSLSAHYSRLYREAATKFGKRTPGRNIVRDGLSTGRAAKDADLRRSIAVLERMLAPPPAPVAAPPALAVSTSYSSSSGGCGGTTPYSGGGQCWAIPYSIVSCESGGQNVPNATGSGAEGYYQLMNGGTGSRAEQDAAAAALWNGGAGAGNWVCAG